MSEIGFKCPFFDGFVCRQIYMKAILAALKHCGVLKRIVSKGSQTTVLKNLIVTQISDSNSHSIQSGNYEQDLVCEAREYEHIFSFANVKNLQTQ